MNKWNTSQSEFPSNPHAGATINNKSDTNHISQSQPLHQRDDKSLGTAPSQQTTQTTYSKFNYARRMQKDNQTRATTQPSLSATHTSRFYDIEAAIQRHQDGFQTVAPGSIQYWRGGSGSLHQPRQSAMLRPKVFISICELNPSNKCKISELNQRPPYNSFAKRPHCTK